MANQNRREFGQDTVTIHDVRCKYETEKALLCVIDDADHWIPISMVSDDSEVYARDTEGQLIITRWIAEQRNLI